MHAPLFQALYTDNVIDSGVEAGNENVAFLIHRLHMRQVSACAGESAAAVNGISSTGDPTGAVGSEEEDKLCHLIGSAGAAQWMSSAAALEKCAISLFTHAAGAVQIGDHDTGIDGIYTHTAIGQL